VQRSQARINDVLRKASPERRRSPLRHLSAKLSDCFRQA
jgi:hypothetical protein